jgi:hypothetical protein
MGPSKKLCSTLKNISRKKMRGDFPESTKQFSYEMMMIYFYIKKISSNLKFLGKRDMSSVELKAN